MPIFNSEAELRNYILDRSRDAIVIAQEQVYQLIGRFLNQYYNEFSPSMYERTYQLLCSLVKSEVRSTGNGWEAEVYFDASALNYTTGTWSGEEVLESAAHGSHGGYVSGTAVFDDPVEQLSSDYIEILKRSLIQAGIPVI